MDMTYEHKIQYYETDQMKIVHHSNYIRWFEEARTDVMERMGFGYDKMEEAGVMSPVLAVNVEYKTMSRYGESVVIDVKVKAYKGVRMTLAYIIKDKATDVIRCLGESKHCFLNMEGKPVSLKKEHPEIHQLLENLLEIS